MSPYIQGKHVNMDGSTKI